ncbi:hypothetical protein FIV42_00905 [Persicimonas caeni]|uniref:Uncharacterized protein n=1 Tax=Persicimonas caeni TaxID=2292766 RepID=A0A4Y6PM89_PERCE|nr:hypothetical protein [Persicimonas caeni]QDG49343.1 hypothetical protein FIV42_00905 [Persicimonas caeni]QED30564.1 hypothetical protein FRD00_00900 [Persicimonas caeni]
MMSSRPSTPLLTIALAALLTVGCSDPDSGSSSGSDAEHADSSSSDTGSTLSDIDFPDTEPSSESVGIHADVDGASQSFVYYSVTKEDGNMVLWANGAGGDWELTLPDVQEGTYNCGETTTIEHFNTYHQADFIAGTQGSCTIQITEVRTGRIVSIFGRFVADLVNIEDPSQHLPVSANFYFDYQQ